MDTEKKLEEQIKKYSEIAKENPNVDLNLLINNAISGERASNISIKYKRWAYLVSIGLPPFGLLFALKYFFSEEEDARQTAWICITLTIISILILWFMNKVLFSSLGPSLEQVQQINPNDIYQLTQ